MVRHLPEDQRKRALTYGMAGAFIFRLTAIFFVTFIMENMWVKVIGAGYLLLLAGKYFLFEEHDDEGGLTPYKSFWGTVIAIELADIAFSIDSILAAVAVSPNRYVVITGGILGIIMMRFSAILFIRLIETFPRLETSAFLLIAVVAVKLLMETFTSINFHSGHAGFYAFWVCMLLGLGYGFTHKKFNALRT
jgi:YkoY family integral membrane protein